MISLTYRPGEPLLFSQRQFLGLTHHAALGSAKGQIHQRVLPGLQHGQRHHLIAVDRIVVTNAALERPPRVVVLSAIAGEDLDVPIIHPHRTGNRQHALGR